MPVERARSSIPTGSIYEASHSDSWFGEKKAYRVGDMVTVVLDESLDADTTTKNTASRKNIAGAGGLFLSDDMQEENEISSSGSGVIDQSATLQGTMTAQVVEVYPNGNLLIRGEKIVNFSVGSEVVQVKGIIRPQDIAPDNTVQSKRLASAQITYKGVGQNANAQRIPWGTNLLLSIWPF
jgi:flagellar L-ring protein precursor FlgH